MKKTVVSLFCGAGGCSRGFEQAGYEVLYAIDSDPSAVRTYSTNFPKTPVCCEDIRDINFVSLMKRLKLSPNELDFLIGGPPCQGFSTAGTRLANDSRNTLLMSYSEAIGVFRPKWFLMENVEGLLTAKNGEYLSDILKTFMALGYHVRIEKIYAHEHGVPQRRKRVMILGNCLGLSFNFPEPTAILKGSIFRSSDRTLRHAIGQLPPAVCCSDNILQYRQTRDNEFEKYLRGHSQHITEHSFPSQNPTQFRRISMLKPGQTMKDLPEELQHESFKKRANRRVMDGTPTEKRGGAPSGIKRLYYDEPCLTITGAAIRELIHPEENRPLTIRECARIQTFPDDFIFCGNTSEKIRQIGNAIPPLLAYIFARKIKDEYGFDGSSEGPGVLISYKITKAEAMSPALKRTSALLYALLSQHKQKCFDL